MLAIQANEPPTVSPRNWRLSKLGTAFHNCLYDGMGGGGCSRCAAGGGGLATMLRYVAVFFFGFVIVEMILLISLGRWLGVLPAILLVLGAGFAGAWLARWQGVRMAFRARSQLAQGVLPTAEMTDGLLIAVAAVLLIIPGVVTDILGLALLFPPTRAVLRRSVVAQFTRRSPLGRFTHEREPHARGGDEIIDARVIETRVVDE